ncbi:MAG: hypothetical protein WC237_00045 [Candidatus Paceibacterota bacterium]|jgi:lysyl-tRNA synthetase class 2
MATLRELKQIRLQKLELLKKAGIDPYPVSVPRDFCLATAKEKFDILQKSSKITNVAGRIVAIRGQGAILFIVIDDGKSRFQLY